MEKRTLPLIPLRDLIIFPHMVTHFDCGRMISVAAIEAAEMQGSTVFLAAQVDANVMEPKEEDVYAFGTVAVIKQILKLPGGIIRVLVEGVCRGKILSYTTVNEYIEVEVETFSEEEPMHTPQVEAAVRLVEEDIDRYCELDTRLIPGLLQSALDNTTTGRLVDTAAGYIHLKLEDNQKLLETVDVYHRLVAFHEIMQGELELLSIEKKIDQQVKNQMNKVQREYYLKEQLRVIHKELGDAEEEEEILSSYREKIEKKQLPEEVRKKALKELQRLGRMNSQSPDYTGIVNYLDWILDLPWMESKNTEIDLAKARQILNAQHYGLKSVKERILEFIAVKKLSNDKSKGPILCLVGPPGVGKTSIARSIAESLNKDFVRMSLGGVTDEAEIRGHRRTYIGSMPGRVITLIKKAGHNDPVFLFDEIDKIGSDYKGDPASGLLEVLDPEQNNTFSDRYLELPFDLSNVFFIATANSTNTIPRPLLDRMEVITLSGYTPDEKFNIAKKYLVPKQITQNGLTKEQLKISDGAIRNMIDYYTREAGVRGLEKEISKAARKSALQFIEESKESISITGRNLNRYLGEKKYRFDEVGKKNEIGAVNGLAWTAVGGETLSIESTIMAGTGKVTLTGSLGDVMKESAIAGISYIASNAEKYGVDPEFRKKQDIHIHVPEGAVPKDGPSAGITITTSVLSALTKQPVRRDIAMTGEITLRGKVLPIGGLKEKLLAAERMGITTVLIPFENKRDLKEIEESAVEKLKILPVKDMGEVAKIAFEE